MAQFLFFLNCRSFNSLFLYLSRCMSWFCAKCPSKAYDVLFPSPGWCREMVAPARASGRKLWHGLHTGEGPLVPSDSPFFLAPGDELFNCLMCHHVLSHYRLQSNTANQAVWNLQYWGENNNLSLGRRRWSRVSAVQTKLAPCFIWQFVIDTKMLRQIHIRAQLPKLWVTGP